MSKRDTAKPVQQKVIRCAIYTRKSTEEGLEQAFNSLDAQRESGEACIAAQRHEGWVCLPDRYDDGGFSGGNIDRPAMQRLLADIEAGKIDCVVVYKVDRLSRSLMDFSRVMQTFEKHNVSFVSVTQQFNTTHSMGRLTLNFLLSFAQFEREIISERTRDKIAAARKKGKWSGGKPLLGYDILSSPAGAKLVVNDDEAQRVRQIFELYLEHQALIELKAGPVMKIAPAPVGRVPRISRLMALAIRFDDLLRRGEVKDYADLARLGHVTRARVTQIMNLLYLAPDIQEALLFLPAVEAGRDPVKEWQVRPVAKKATWQQQRQIWHRARITD